MNPSTDPTPVADLVAQLTDRMATLTRTLATWMLADTRTLADVETHVLPLLHDLGAAIVTGACGLAVSPPAATHPCACGRPARLIGSRPATVITLLGPLTLARPVYHCAACHHGHAPFDAHFQICPGSRSAGLDEALALLGATQDSFADAAQVLARLTLVQISPNSVRAATETLGATLMATQTAQVAAVQAGQTRPIASMPAPDRLYVTMDGVLAHLHDGGWREIKVGCCYTTTTRRDRQHPGQVAIHAHQPSYVTALTEAETFGWHLWCEAARRGVMQAAEVVVLGDGAHWIWNMADALFPQATQILDWYHASQYLWDAATAIWGAAHPERVGWARDQLADLWDGKVDAVLAGLATHADAGEGVTAAISYYTTHRTRMDYPTYRARGMQIGSGSVESACKQLVSARLKGAGMIWDGEGAEAVAAVRACLKSGRWAEAMACRAAPQRGYIRQRGASAPQPVDRPLDPPAQPHAAQTRREADAARVAQVRAELERENAIHPWQRKREMRQRWQDLHTREAEVPPAQAA